MSITIYFTDDINYRLEFNKQKNRYNISSFSVANEKIFEIITTENLTKDSSALSVDLNSKDAEKIYNWELIASSSLLTFLEDHKEISKNEIDLEDFLDDKTRDKWISYIESNYNLHTKLAKWVGNSIYVLKEIKKARLKF